MGKVAAFITNYLKKPAKPQKKKNKLRRDGPPKKKAKVGQNAFDMIMPMRRDDDEMEE